MRIRAKGKLLLLACIFFVFSVGFAGTEPVKMLDEPIPLIDLNAAIKDAIPPRPQSSNIRARKSRSACAAKHAGLVKTDCSP